MDIISLFQVLYAPILISIASTFLFLWIKRYYRDFHYFEEEMRLVTKKMHQLLDEVNSLRYENEKLTEDISNLKYGHGESKLRIIENRPMISFALRDRITSFDSNKSYYLDIVEEYENLRDTTKNEFVELGEIMLAVSKLRGISRNLAMVKFKNFRKFFPEAVQMEKDRRGKTFVRISV